MRPIELNQQKQFVVLDILSEIPSQEIETEDKKNGSQVFLQCQ